MTKQILIMPEKEKTNHAELHSFFLLKTKEPKNQPQTTPPLSRGNILN